MDAARHDDHPLPPPPAETGPEEHSPTSHDVVQEHRDESSARERDPVVAVPIPAPEMTTARPTAIKIPSPSSANPRRRSASADGLARVYTSSTPTPEGASPRTAPISHPQPAVQTQYDSAYRTSFPMPDSPPPAVRRGTTYRPGTLHQSPSYGGPTVPRSRERQETGGPYPHGVASMSRRSVYDDLVPLVARNLDPQPNGNMPSTEIPLSIQARNVEHRLTPTLVNAKVERDQCRRRARITGYALNATIGMQVIFGALTTGVAAATTGHQTSIAVSVLGGLSTLAASYLARARGSGQPEKSIIQWHELDSYVRDLEAFILDHGHTEGDEYDVSIERYRRRFEEIMGNLATGGVQGQEKTTHETPAQAQAKV